VLLELTCGLSVYLIVVTIMLLFCCHRSRIGLVDIQERVLSEKLVLTFMKIFLPLMVLM